MLATIFLAILLPVAVTSQNTANMNPTLKYTIANPAPGYEGATFPFRGESFEVTTPSMVTQYSQVFWQPLPAVALPDAIIRRFANRTIAITGFEVDVRRRNNATGEEESVPAYQSYNHHYSPNIISSYAEAVLDDHGMPTGPNHGHGKMLTFALKKGMVPAPPSDAILNQCFVHGNGQEHRQIYHGAPPGYVQTIFSPGSFVLSPMQINTNDGTGRTAAGGLLPRIKWDTQPADVPYSPLLECPCTTRVPKTLGRVSSVVTGKCPLALLESDCFAAATSVMGTNIVSNTTISNASLPSGCSVARVASGQNVFRAVFNTDTASPTACDVSSSAAFHLVGTQHDLITLSVDVNGAAGFVTITMTGPAAVWYGAAFNASQMADLPYAIIVDGNGIVQERKLMDQNPGNQISASVAVLSNTVAGGVRTLVLQRPMVGATADHYTFSASVGNIPFLNAYGASANLSYHKARGASFLQLFHADTATSCLCTDGGGTINGIGYHGDCQPEPLSDLLRDNNPTCQVSSYVGGLACCGNKQLLIDADQVPPPFFDVTYFKFRFYFEEHDPLMQQEIYHVEWSLNGCDSGAGGPNPYRCAHLEFDVVAGAGSADVQVFQTTFPAGGMLESSCAPMSEACMDGTKVGPKGFKLILAATHCHAPNCLRQELINADTNETLCVGTPVHGTSSDVFDEKGYLFTPPCTWGEGAGFTDPPVLHPNTTLRMVVYYNSTYGHPGQMGIWQMKAAFVV